MPEGDTIHRAAAALRTALTGRAITRFDAPRLYGPRPGMGRVIERVATHGKHLEIMWDDGIVLHTHLRMNGSWHLYRGGERWRRPSDPPCALPERAAGSVGADAGSPPIVARQRSPASRPVPKA